MSKYTDRQKVREAARTALALSYGAQLPNPRAPDVATPGFLIGKCSHVYFSPTGRHVVVGGSAGHFVWDVDARRRLCKLKSISNPTQLSFSPDGGQLLMRNERGVFAHYAMPAGELLLKYKAAYRYRLDGRGCIGPQGTVLQLASPAVILLIEEGTGRILARYELEESGVFGEVYWLPRRQAAFIVQGSAADAKNLSQPCALWQWRAPLADHVPERMDGHWISLTSSLFGEDTLLLHHQRSALSHEAFVIDALDLDAMTTTRLAHCGGSIMPEPGLSFDRRAWAVKTNEAAQIGIGDDVITVPDATAHVAFHPTRDLVGVTGDEGFIAPLAIVRAYCPR